ncbi:MAG: hypothetical protein R6V06_03495 [Kiritimatiellia bacterium]
MKIFKPVCVSFFLTATCMILCLNSGCKPSAEKLARQQAESEQMLQDTLAEIAELEAEQKFTEAEKLITSALKNKSLASNRDYLLSRKSELLTRQNKLHEAEELILSYLKTDPSVTQNALNTLFHYYYNNKQFVKSIDFSKKLLDAGQTIPLNLLKSVLSQRLAAAVGTEDRETIRAAVDSIMTSINDSSVAVTLIEPHVGELLRKRKFTLAQAMASHLANSASSNADYKNLAAVINIRRVTASQNWSELKEAYTHCIEQLPDKDLSKIMRLVFISLQKAKQNELLKECTELGISFAKGKQRSIDYAALKWAETLFRENNGSLPGSLNKLQTTPASPNQIAMIFDHFFYEVADNEKIIKELCAVGTELVGKCSETNIANSLKVKILDGAFIVEDYDLAVSLLEKGIPGKDEIWHAMSLPKVKAHRAQANNKPREAVKYYREFMNCWENSEKEEEFDPTSGIAYSKEWILARNATRIAKILDSIPDQAGADKARKEAEKYFKIAIEKAETDKAALKLVTKEAAKLK